MVVAVYRALLGRRPDPDGLAHWTQLGDLEQLVTAVAATEEHRGRVRLQAGAEGAGSDLGAARGRRLEAGDGLVALDDERPSAGVLATFPWDEVAESWADLPPLVLGPYGHRLAAEIERRGYARRARSGLSGLADGARIGTLVLTDPGYLRALAEVRPQVLDAAPLRVLHPVRIRLDRPVDERELQVHTARQRLHALGYIEVSQVYARRHGGGTVVVDTTFTMPEPGNLLTVAGAPAPPGGHPGDVWLVARRVPVGDRA
jgi:hypothetical protein